MQTNLIFMTRANFCLTAAESTSAQNAQGIPGHLRFEIHDHFPPCQGNMRLHSHAAKKAKLTSYEATPPSAPNALCILWMPDPDPSTKLTKVHNDFLEAAVKLQIKPLLHFPHSWTGRVFNAAWGAMLAAHGQDLDGGQQGCIAIGEGQKPPSTKT